MKTEWTLSKVVDKLAKLLQPSKSPRSDLSWKDEYITVVVTAPLWLLVLGSLQNAAGFGTSIISDTILVVTAIRSAGIDIGFLMEVVVIAAVGARIWRR